MNVCAIGDWSPTKVFHKGKISIVFRTFLQYRPNFPRNADPSEARTEPPATNPPLRGGWRWGCYYMSEKNLKCKYITRLLNIDIECVWIHFYTFPRKVIQVFIAIYREPTAKKVFMINLKPL